MKAHGVIVLNITLYLYWVELAVWQWQTFAKGSIICFWCFPELPSSYGCSSHSPSSCFPCAQAALMSEMEMRFSSFTSFIEIFGLLHVRAYVVLFKCLWLSISCMVAWKGLKGTLCTTFRITLKILGTVIRLTKCGTTSFVVTLCSKWYFYWRSCQLPVFSYKVKSLINKSCALLSVR